MLSSRRTEISAVRFPIKGFLYLLTAPTMWGTVICVALLGIAVAIGTLVALFMVALEPQAEAFGGGKWWSYVLAVVAVIFESLLASALILKVVHSKCQKRIFVETMRIEGTWKDGMIEPSLAKDVNCCRIGFLIKVITFPLNLIPVAGTFLYAFINAPFEAWDLMDMYFDAIQMGHQEQLVEVSGRGSLDRSCCAMYASSEYVKFGFVAMLLETIPIAGPALFSLSNACGAALWASAMEVNGGPPTIREDSKISTLVTAPVTDYGAGEKTAEVTVSSKVF